MINWMKVDGILMLSAMATDDAWLNRLYRIERLYIPDYRTIHE